MAQLDLAAISNSIVATKYAYVASAALLFWDIILTFDQEVSRVWRARKTFGTTLFFCNRYLPPALFILDLLNFESPQASNCKDYELSSTLLDLASIAVVECTLIMRTHALYQNRLVLNSLSALGVISIANMATCFLIVLNHETFVPASTLGLLGCLSGCTSPLCRPLLIAFWIPFLLLESIIFVLTAWKSYQAFVVGQGVRSVNLVSILFRDGLIYYVVIMSVSIFNFLIWILDPFASYLAVGLLKSLQATICSRLLLNIRGMLEPQEMTVVSRSRSRSDVITLSTLQGTPPTGNTYDSEVLDSAGRRKPWPSNNGWTN